MQKPIISYFLLALLLLVNWHNTFIHSHHHLANDHQSLIAHHHRTDHHHQHHLSTFWDWIKQKFGDFEHADQGNDHLELFIKTNQQVDFDIVRRVEVQLLFTFLLDFDLQKSTIIQRGNLIFSRLLSPQFLFLNTALNRGPPLYFSEFQN